MLVPAGAHAREFGPYAVEQYRVIDGDTVEMMLIVYPNEYHRIKIREAHINTPEKRTRSACEKRAGIAATEFTEQFLKNKRIMVHRVREGKYAGRLLGAIFADGVSLASQLLEHGHAVRYEGGKREPWCQD